MLRFIFETSRAFFLIVTGIYLIEKLDQLGHSDIMLTLYALSIMIFVVEYFTYQTVRFFYNDGEDWEDKQ